jgi:hypothetical protein
MENQQLVPITGVVSPVINQIIVPQENEMATLSQSILEWRRLMEECAGYKEQIRERTKKINVLRDIIVRIMKGHNVAALDLKATGGRVVTKQKKSQSGLTAKTLQGYLTTYLKSETEATKLIEFIQKNRQVSTKDALFYEKP